MAFGDVQTRDRSGIGPSVVALPLGVDSSWMDDSVNAGVSSSYSAPPEPPLRLV